MAAPTAADLHTRSAWVVFNFGKEFTMTSSLIVLAFDTMDEAEQVHEALVRGKKEGLVTIEDAAVVVKDAEGKVHVKNQVSRSTWATTGVGGALGLLIGGIIFPIGGLVLGLAGGAVVGRLMDMGVDGKFVKDVGEQIKPGTSALFVLLKGENPAAEVAILRPYKGHVLQTTLDSDAEQAIRDALEDASAAN
jgi:uncharacterized membrane protein